MPPRGGRHNGPRGASRAAIIALLRASPTMLTTPQIMARVGLTKIPTLLHLAALEAAGRIGKVTGRPYRWFWRGTVSSATACSARNSWASGALI